MILFLDYDGVLHPDEVYLIKKRPLLRTNGALCMHAGLLADALVTRPDIKIVLSTSWVPSLGFDRAKSYLPQELQDRVIGATRHSKNGLTKNNWFLLSRHYQISTYVNRHHLTDWLAIDDNDLGWPDAQRHHLIHCANPATGISDPTVLAEIREKLGAKK